MSGRVAHAIATKRTSPLLASISVWSWRWDSDVASDKAVATAPRNTLNRPALWRAQRRGTWDGVCDRTQWRAGPGRHNRRGWTDQITRRARLRDSFQRHTNHFLLTAIQ